jgi:hypothetical protein
MTTTTTNKNPNDTHQTITQQHQNSMTTDTTQDQHSTTQNKQQVPGTPGHRDPMVRAAGPNGPAAKIHNWHVVDLAMTTGRSLADRAMVRSC